jgi:hypothetical protein
VRALAVLGLAATLAILVGTAGAGISETIRLAPRGASGVSGTATVSSPGDRAAARVVVHVRGLRAGAAVRVVLDAGSCTRPGASVTKVLSARAGAAGTLTAAGRVRYRGAPVTFSAIADGAHAFSVVAGGRVVACGVLPGIS